MLTELTIENAAVIKSLTISLKNGFSAFTGETGAGKSIIFDCIDFVTGGNTNVDIIRYGSDYVSVSAVFEDVSDYNLSELESVSVSPDEDGVLILERILNSDGKNKFKINGKTVSRGIYKECGGILISMSGQNENTVLLNKQAHIDILDDFAGTSKELENYKAAYSVYSGLLSSVKSLNTDESERARRIDMLNFVINEIESAKLKPGDEENLFDEKIRLKNIEKIVKASSDISKSLFKGGESLSAYDLCFNARKSILSVSDYFPDSDKHIEKLDDIISYLQDLSAISEEMYDSDDVGNPDEKLDKIESKLNTIEKLKKKYGNSIEDILEYLAESKKELSDLRDYDSNKTELEKKLKESEKSVASAAQTLHKKRFEAAASLKKKVEDKLQFLDMKGAEFDVSFTETESPQKNGTDKIEFLIKANPGEEMKSLADTASGGELSRILLAIKSAAYNIHGTDTIIFDEIDSGVSGKTALKIGKLLRESSNDSQLLCITHSPQVASAANHHYIVKKTMTDDNRVESNAYELDYDGRVKEIARIIGGEKITDEFIASAEELISQTEQK